jgi:pyruvate-formate lyase-activating enzyme
MLCLAPWTTLTLYSRHHQPVPCAPAWVDTKMGSIEQARELNASPLRVLWANNATRIRKGYGFFDPSNEDWSLGDMWNGPMYRQMRGEMAPGGRSHRCRDSCRVILGVEERGVPFFQFPDADIDPRVASNRARLRAEIGRGATVLEATPLELTLGVSAHCNFTCGFCSGPQGEYGELSERRLAEVIAWLPGLMQLTVVGPGEPLMSASFLRLLEHIATAGYPSLTVSLTTNGTLARPTWLKRHANIRWGQIRFSINAGSAATHERMTGKRLFDQLLENIEAVVELRAGRSEPFVFVLSCVLSRLIYGDLARYAEIVNRYDALPVLEPMTGNMNDLSPFVDQESTRRLMEECEVVASAWRERNTKLYRAFEAMARFARKRLERDDFTMLPAE